MTEIELHSELMSYPDRFASVFILAFENFDALTPAPEASHAIMGETLYTLSAFLTIAAGPNSQTALRTRWYWLRWGALSTNITWAESMARRLK